MTKTSSNIAHDENVQCRFKTHVFFFEDFARPLLQASSGFCSTTPPQQHHHHHLVCTKNCKAPITVISLNLTCSNVDFATLFWKEIGLSPLGNSCQKLLCILKSTVEKGKIASQTRGCDAPDKASLSFQSSLSFRSSSLSFQSSPCHQLLLRFRH